MLVESPIGYKMRISSFAGGTGGPNFNEALLKTGQVNNIESIATVYDSGGATGYMRQLHPDRIAYSDAMRLLFSLIDPEEKDDPAYKRLKEKFNYRYRTRNGKSKVLGHRLMHGFFDTETGFAKAEAYLESKGFSVLGHVYPSSVLPADIVFSTESGDTYFGEHNIDDHNQESDKITNMWLEPAVKAFEPAVQAAKESDIIFFPFGTIHGSVLVPLLAAGMPEAVQANEGKIVLATNNFTTANELDKNVTPDEYVNLFTRYTGRQPDILLTPALTREKFEFHYPAIAKSYADKEQRFIGWQERQLQDFADRTGITVITHDATVVKEGEVVHDTDLLAPVLIDVFNAADHKIRIRTKELAGVAY